MKTDSDIVNLLCESDLFFLTQKDVIENGSIMFESSDPTYKCFSNFYFLENPIEYDGIKYPTTEHFYQALKTTDHECREYISRLETPGKAKKYCGVNGKIQIRNEWDSIKYSIMYWGVKQKFLKNEKIKDILLATKPHQLIEWTWWGDIVWGMDSKTREGNNALGKILKMIRDE